MQALNSLLRKLEGFYGVPEPPRITAPFEMILLENVAYLVNDAKREAAFRALRDKVGLEPKKILSASAEKLNEVAALGGIVREIRVEKLRSCAEIAVAEFGGNVDTAAELPIARARKALKQFPGIGEPAADRILLFSRNHPVFSMDSNMLRTLLRLGFGQEKKSYAASYRSVLNDLQPQLPAGYDALILAYQLFRRHGQEICKKSRPKCGECPVFPECHWPLKG